MAKPCDKCKKNVTAKQNPGISCVDCSHHWHWKCTTLTEEAISAIKSSKDLSWTCGKCKRRSIIIVDPPIVTKTPVTNTNTNKRQNNNTSSTAAPNSDLVEKLNSALARIDQLESTVDSLKSQVVALTEKSAQFDSLSSTVTSLDTICNSLEKNNVSETLEIQNLPEVALSDPVAAVVQIGRSINCPVTPSDFSSEPHRVNKRIRLPFKCKNLRRKFLLAGKEFNRKKSQFIVGNQKFKIHINQELTTLQRSLFDLTKRFASSNDYKFVWFDVNGKLLIKKNENSLPIAVHSSDTLNNEDLLPKCPRTSIQVSDLPTGSSVQ